MCRDVLYCICKTICPFWLKKQWKWTRVQDFARTISLYFIGRVGQGNQRIRHESIWEWNLIWYIYCKAYVCVCVSLSRYTLKCWCRSRGTKNKALVGLWEGAHHLTGIIYNFNLLGMPYIGKYFGPIYIYIISYTHKHTNRHVSTT